VQQSFDTIGRLTTVASGATNYASAFAYNTAFQVRGFNYGNGVAATLNYSDDRLQMTSLSYVKGATTLYSLNYYYKTDATHCPAGTANNNGQIQCITDNVDNGRSAKYTYDALARLTAASTVGSTAYPAWGLSFTYDRYANRTQQTARRLTKQMQH
jgi:YD repeat-containing protein